ncbi:ABC transporter ATP-binding protein [Meiothermus sp.]|uniref:ABC transporter ATP-binding protein n=1 Tax=Meiothermus sp. TaxID=1955249 RepID=UPI0021DC251A|nr:ABC transporter ATP-binding protein [Meiothermus sp.]GIW33342.1 MAG: nitrate/sulfonate/bicarbonate ABC transporter ATP-binding protein [Meiothermus sp.]
MDSRPLISVSDVYKRYPDGTLALEGVNLEVRPGEFVSLVGPSGCGKSTLLRMLAGLEDITAGRVQVEGYAPESAQARSDMSFVFQEPTLLPWRTVLHNVALPLELRGVGIKERTERAKEVLDLVGLGPRAGAFPRTLSGGMKMRVSIARALITRPKIILMDEPFGALDEMTRQRLNDELLSLKQSTGATVVFVTHNMFEAVYLSQRIAVMTPHPGRIAETIEVPVPYPRDSSFRASETYGKLVYGVLRALEGYEALPPAVKA